MKTALQVVRVTSCKLVSVVSTDLLFTFSAKTTPTAICMIYNYTLRITQFHCINLICGYIFTCSQSSADTALFNYMILKELAFWVQVRNKNKICVHDFILFFSIIITMKSIKLILRIWVCVLLCLSPPSVDLPLYHCTTIFSATFNTRMSSYTYCQWGAKNSMRLTQQITPFLQHCNRLSKVHSKAT